MPTVYLGKNAKTYRGAAGATAATLVENLSNVDLNMDSDSAEANSRANGGWKTKVQTLRECSVDFEMIWDADDEGFAAFRDAYLTGGLVALLVLDREGGEGPDGDFSITKFSRAEPLTGPIVAKVTAELSVFREWKTPASGE